MARRLAGFDCRILAYDPRPDEDFARSHGVQLLPLVEVLAQADILSLHLPATAETRGMVNDGFLARMKPGAYLINTARGELIDEDALLRALQSGHLAGAALDAFSQQPPDPANSLLTLPQVLVTPHTGAHADLGHQQHGLDGGTRLLAVLRGEDPKFRVV